MQHDVTVRVVLMTSSKRSVASATALVNSSSSPDARLSKPVRRAHLRKAIDCAFGLSGPGDSASHGSRRQARLNLRVLLVEDSPVNREVATGMLESLGCTVGSASDGNVGVEQALSWGFDLVLMDCQMPLMDGYEATRRIRMAEAAAGRKPIPIVALTANALQGDRERCLDSGMTDFISKPFTMNKLHDVLRALTSAAETSSGNAVDAAPQEMPVVMNGADDTLPVVDVGQIAELRSLGRPQIVQRAVTLFQEQAEKNLDELDSALLTRGAADVERAAHALKSAALSIGGRRFAAAAGNCEQAARAGDVETAGRLARILRPEFASLATAIKKIADEEARAA
jgi:CheY-like chemotaxis protein/HPt (histidine-containing phosphotransfer) domain-containing protein